MSYEEDYRSPYAAKCACGKGFLRFYRIHLSNDWGQERETDTPVELFCNDCKDKYHYEQFRGEKYLVPNDMSFPKQHPQLERKYEYTEKEEMVRKYAKYDIENMVADMTAPKHRYIKHLENKNAIAFAERWVIHYKKKSLVPMVSYLQNLLNEYHILEESCKMKKTFVDEYERAYRVFSDKTMQIEAQSIRLSFHYDEV